MEGVSRLFGHPDETVSKLLGITERCHVSHDSSGSQAEPGNEKSGTLWHDFWEILNSETVSDILPSFPFINQF